MNKCRKNPDVVQWQDGMVITTYISDTKLIMETLHIFLYPLSLACRDIGKSHLLLNKICPSFTDKTTENMLIVHPCKEFLK